MSLLGGSLTLFSRSGMSFSVKVGFPGKDCCMKLTVPGILNNLPELFWPELFWCLIRRIQYLGS